MYYCHSCIRECSQLTCEWCGSDFVEEIEDTQQDRQERQELQDEELDLQDMFRQSIAHLLMHGPRHQLPDDDDPHRDAADASNGAERSRPRRQARRSHPYDNPPPEPATSSSNNQSNRTRGPDLHQQMMMHMIQQLAGDDFNRHLEAHGHPRVVFQFMGNENDNGPVSLQEFLSQLFQTNAGPELLDEEFLNSLPRVQFSSTQHQDSKTCPICVDDYIEGAEMIQLPCNHTFHPSCVLDWFKINNTCPLCRLTLSSTGEHDIPDKAAQSSSQQQPPVD